MFTPTHFVQTDEIGAENNHVENGQLVQEVSRRTNALTNSTIVDVVTAGGAYRSVFDYRLQPFDDLEHQVTCDVWPQTPHGHNRSCRDARVVVPEEPEPEVDARPALIEFLRSLRATLDEIESRVYSVEQVLRESVAKDGGQ